MSRSPDANAVVDPPREVSARGLPVPSADESTEEKFKVVVSPELIPVCTLIYGVSPLSRDVPLYSALAAIESISSMYVSSRVWLLVRVAALVVPLADEVASVFMVVRIVAISDSAESAICTAEMPALMLSVAFA